MAEANDNKSTYESNKKDKPNATRLKELATRLNKLKPKNIDSSEYLLNVFKIYEEQHANAMSIMPAMFNSDTVANFVWNPDLNCNLNQKCKLSECNALNRIKAILQNHVQNSDAEYSNIDLLNDHNHILMKHYTEFEDVYNIFTQSVDENNHKHCDLTQCLMRQRNHRNRSDFSNNNTQQTLYQLYGYKHDKDIAKQQLMDRIHSYYLHSFDTGYKLTQQQRQTLLQPVDDDDDDSKNDINCTDLHVSRIRNMVKSTHDEHKEAENMNRFTTNTNEMSYSYGYRYFYWSYYKDNNNIHDDAHLFAHVNEAPVANEGCTVSDWYIDKKYDNLKEELLCNELCVIAESQWNVLNIKADALLATDKAKRIKCPRTNSLKYYDFTVYQTPLMKPHMLVMLTYCNFNTLQFKFSETFRRMHESETDNELKNRHRNYYFVGKLLRECTECFGYDTAAQNVEHISLYHGVNQQFLFSTLFAYIKGPFSTTIDFAVASNFCANEGMILNLKINVGEWVYNYDEGMCNSRLSCFDVSWISDFTNEQEVFFIGGMGKFEFYTVIKPEGINYEKYIHGLKQMSCCMSVGDRTFSCDIPKTDEEMQIVFRLISHELWRNTPDDKRAIVFKNCPNYIKKLLHLHCLSVKKFGYYRWVSEDSKMHAWLFENDDGWIKIDFIMCIFPNIEKISVDATHKDIEFVTQQSIYQSVLAFLDDNKKSKLREIEIQINDEHMDEISTCMHLYQENFNNHSWNIAIKTDVFEMNIGPKKEDIESIGRNDFAEEFLLGTEMHGLFDIDSIHNAQELEHEKVVENRTFIVMNVYDK